METILVLGGFKLWKLFWFKDVSKMETVLDSMKSNMEIISGFRGLEKLKYGNYTGLSEFKI